MRSKAKINPCVMPMLMGQTEEAKHAKEMGSQTCRWVISNTECQGSKKAKIFHKEVVNGVRSNKIVGDLVLTSIIGEASFTGVVGTQTKTQWAGGKVRDEDSCILWLLASISHLNF